MDDDLLNCPVCLDYADKAVETLCCGNIFCEGCLLATGNTCPFCRHEGVQHRVSMLARRVIAALPVQCPFLCDATLTRYDVETHVKSCPNRQYTCADTKCAFVATKAEMGKHLSQCHCDVLIEKMNLLFNPAPVLPSSPSPEYPGPGTDPVVQTTNDRGSSCRLGDTGKYYCGQAGCNVRMCCDGRCGPTNGCNCASCQRLDIRMKRVPPGFMVNKQGALCRLGLTGKFYCGRRVMTHDRRTDGYCGPTDGNQCASCEIVQRQTRPGYLYGDVWRDVKLP